MAGLYIHIPFCRDACTYCDFHFSISLGQLSPMLKAIQKELITERNFLKEEEIGTIYLGGGTPSVLMPEQIDELFSTIRHHYNVRTEAEITMEANPDDLNPEYLLSLRQTGINRLSIGIQSFQDKELESMNRRHDSKQAGDCLLNARKAGFENLNLDLIYGLPGLSSGNWEINLKTALAYRPSHLAAYHLGYESGTRLDYHRIKGQTVPIEEKGSLAQYKMLIEKTKNQGYLHYEISNFALPGFISKHNSAYWMGENYLGVGPSAHSYNGNIRRWNMSRNSSFIKTVLGGKGAWEEEKLDKKARFHDYVMTSLRTMWGLDLEYIRNEWGNEYFEHALKNARSFIDSEKMIMENNQIILNEEGMFIADYIIRELFI